MSDWRDDEREERPPGRSTTPAGEGVRILGSEAGGGGRPSFAAGDDEDDSWSASSEGWAPRPSGESSGSMPLPHWTDPPTGEVPRILDDETSDDLESWSTLTGSTPRFRTDAGDWAAGDFEAGELDHDDSTLVGALDENPAEDSFGTPMTRKARREAREAAEAASKQKGRRTRAPSPGPEPVDDSGGGHEFPPADESGLPPGSLEGPPRRAPEPRAPQGGTGADTPQRVITALIAAGVALLAFALGKGPTLVLGTAIVGIGAFEFYEALRRAGYHTATLVGLLGCVAVVPVAYDQGYAAFPMMIFLVTAFTMLWYLFEVMRARPTINVALTLLVFVYVGCFGAFAGLFLAADNGVGYVIGVVLCVIAYDVVGWFVGSTMGHTPLMPRISPNKTF